MQHVKLATAAIGVLAGLGLTAVHAADATVDIRRDDPGPTIEPTVYGHFAEHLGRGIYEGVWVGENSDIANTGGFRNDVVEALKRLEVPVVRWPGGCFADEYHWRDGIGPRDERPVRVNTHWGWVTEDNAFGTHEFLNFAELIGAEAYVAGNMGSGTPAEMARWVEYMTGNLDTTLVRERQANGREEPWDVKYFGVGNESWGCGGNMSAEYSADLHRRYATFIKTPPGTDIIKVATGANVDDYRFTEMLMTEARPWTTDAISVHYYTFPGRWEDKGPSTGFARAQWASTLANARRMDELVTRHAAIMDVHDPDNEVALYVDEWGTWYDLEPGSTPGFLYQQNTIRDALVGALTFNIFHRHTDRVKMANIAQMVNVLQASILTDGEDMLLTPTYHLLDLYKPFKGATPLAADVDSPEFTIGGFTLPHLDVSAARGADGKLWLALVNLHPEEAIRVDAGEARGATGRVLTAPAMDTHNTFDQPERVKPAAFQGERRNGRLTLELPPRSVVVVSIE